MHLSFVTEEIWRGNALLTGQQVDVAESRGLSTDTSWTLFPGTTPLLRGSRSALFLTRSMEFYGGRWSLDNIGMYGLLDYSERLVFSRFGRGTPIRQFHDNINRASWHLDHPYEGRVLGWITNEDGGPPHCMLRMSVAGSQFTAQADTSGWFEIDNVPFGSCLLEATGPAGRAVGHLDLSDETLDTLAVSAPPSVCERKGDPPVSPR